MTASPGDMLCNISIFFLLDPTGIVNHFRVKATKSVHNFSNRFQIRFDINLAKSWPIKTTLYCWCMDRGSLFFLILDFSLSELKRSRVCPIWRQSDPHCIQTWHRWYWLRLLDRQWSQSLSKRYQLTRS